MLRKLPPLIQLRVFEAAARHLSFKLAAHGIHIPSSAISHQTKMLEKIAIHK
jgi:LysR family glycine cleavage system transcriptional activator